MNTDDAAVPVERRASERFPIERELRYKVMGKKGPEATGDGLTLNMSSGGILFTTNEVLLPGRRVEVSISWPAQLNERCALRFVAKGRIVRFEEGKAAMIIQQYEFRTQSLRP